MSAPTTPIIDLLTRVENPLSDGGKWSQPVLAADNQVIASTASGAGPGAAGYGGAYRNDASYTDVEVYYTVVTNGGELQIFLRGQNFVTGVDGYLIDFLSTTVNIYNMVAGGSTFQTSFSCAAPVATDVIGARMVGTALTPFKNGVDLGTWNDSTYTAAGNIAFDLATNSVIKNFGGGIPLVGQSTRMPIDYSAFPKQLLRR